MYNFQNGRNSISLIHEYDVIGRMLNYLGELGQAGYSSLEKLKAIESGPVVTANFDDGCPGYEERAIMVH